MNFLPETDASLDFIRASLEVLQDECPVAYESLCRQMDGRSLLLVIDQEQMHLHFSADNVHVEAVSADEDAAALTRLLTSAQTLLDLADARLTIVEAVLQGCLDLYGNVDDLGVLYESILTYVRGSIRCQSAPTLLDHYRSVHAAPIP